MAPDQTSKPSLPPPAIVFALTSDDEDKNNNNNGADESNLLLGDISIFQSATRSIQDGSDDFLIELDDDSVPRISGSKRNKSNSRIDSLSSIDSTAHHWTTRNPHEAALLRRSPSPSSLSLNRQPLPPPSTTAKTIAPSSALLSPDSYKTSFLQPPHSMPGAGGSGSMGEYGSSDGNGSNDAITMASPMNIAGKGGNGSNPFNFQTQYISTSPVKSNVGMRRGHRYKHSSISAQHQIFQEPPQRPPPVLPASLPLPTLREAWASMQRDQRARLYWCLCHAAVAVFVFLCAALEDGGDSLALTALSHLVFFDVGSAAVCVAVDVLGNFEVWRRATIRHPFGLRRAEVLAGFAMSIFLVFGGFDLLSHDLKDCFEASTMSVGSPIHEHSHYHSSDHHSADTGHHTRYVHPGSVDIPALAAFASTLVSAYGLGNHARIRRALLLLHGVAPYSSSKKPSTSRVSKMDSQPPYASSTSPSFLSSISTALAILPGLPAVLANPFHFLTLGVSLVLLLLPLLFISIQPWLDRLLCATIALSMLLLGARLAVAQGLMLLMSFAGKSGGIDISGDSASGPASSSLSQNGGVSSVLDEIAAEPQIARVEDAQFWQVHYGLCMANLRLRVVRGCDDSTMRQLRARVSRVIQNRLGEGYGRGNSLRWEVTVQTSVEGG